MALPDVLRELANLAPVALENRAWRGAHFRERAGAALVACVSQAFKHQEGAVKENRSGRSQFNLSGLAGFLAFCIILGVLISFHSRNIDRVSAFVFLGFRFATGIM